MPRSCWMQCDLTRHQISNLRGRVQLARLTRARPLSVWRRLNAKHAAGLWVRKRRLARLGGGGEECMRACGRGVRVAMQQQARSAQRAAPAACAACGPGIATALPPYRTADPHCYIHGQGCPVAHPVHRAAAQTLPSSACARSGSTAMLGRQRPIQRVSPGGTSWASFMVPMMGATSGSRARSRPSSRCPGVLKRAADTMGSSVGWNNYLYNCDLLQGRCLGRYALVQDGAERQQLTAFLPPLLPRGKPALHPQSQRIDRRQSHLPTALLPHTAPAQTAARFAARPRRPLPPREPASGGDQWQCLSVPPQLRLSSQGAPASRLQRDLGSLARPSPRRAAPPAAGAGRWTRETQAPPWRPQQHARRSACRRK